MPCGIILNKVCKPFFLYEFISFFVGLAAAQDKTGNTEAQFRQAIAAKDRTIVALLVDKEDLRLQLQELREKLETFSSVPATATSTTAVAAKSSVWQVKVPDSKTTETELEKVKKEFQAFTEFVKEAFHDATVCPGTPFLSFFFFYFHILACVSLS